MSGKNVWNRIYIFEKFSFFGPKYVKKMVFWDISDFQAPKIEKWAKNKGENQKSVANIFSNMFSSRF